MSGSKSGDSRKRFTGRLARITSVAVILFGARNAGADSPPLWGRLSPGPYAVGFRSTWELDYSRTYNTTFDDKTTYAPGKAPRPVLVNVWYPAERSGDARLMPHGGYFEIGSDDARLGKLAAKLAEYARGVLRTELFGKSAAELSERERRLLERLLATPTACTRGAKPLDRKGPVLIYHCGAGSSFEDNSVLCEFLASHGYVVIGSAFQQAAGTTFNIDGGEGSAREMAFLIGYASRLPYADWGHVAIAGHSAGAQASLVYASRGSTPVDAVVSLDTTQDYESLADHGWTEFVPVVLSSSPNMTMPILFAANAHAIFELADALVGSERDLLTFKDLHHNDFISQGLFKRMLESWSDQAGKDIPRPPTLAGSPQASYESLCEYILAFLDTRLRGDLTRHAALDAKFSLNTIGSSLPHVEHIAAGVKAAPPYRDTAGKPPEPRQLRGLLKDRGLEATIVILKAAHQKSPDAPVFHTGFGIALIYELLEKGRKSDAVAFHQLYRSFDSDFRRPFFYVGKSYLGHGMKTRARDFLEKAVALDPGDPEAAEQLKAVDGALKAP
jgi:pimeloyl-ACP methyl ester carboxylesterase